ncbi:protein phosphatase 1 regulatory subunit 1B isoform X2 [Poecilia formosa]|uniref:protein phosphatase 1 regulatory subunit 1B isoform X2 n=1 Tax=Poecilia formosa TaxID=48698 RepID=UPI0007B7F7EA|nr:PREDICTED: protein phosphatase 1 regulatory subunit 1B isoform X2 [Poecilia formosa]
MSPTSLKSDSAELRQEQEAARSGTTQLWEVPPERVQRSFGLHWESEPRKSRNMEPSMSTEVEGEHKERKKIQFAVPASAPTNLDPRQVEMIRRRRPTPATLFRVADQSPEDDQSTHQWVVGENGVLKPKRVNQNVYQPPSLKAVQKMAEAQMQKLGVYPLEDPCEGDEDEDHWEGEEGDEASPAKAADHQDTATTERFSSVKETTKEKEAPQEEDEEEEDVEKKEDKIENSRGCN